MTTEMEQLAGDYKLRTLLEEYGRLKKSAPAAEWHDRIMAWEGVEPDHLSSYHGLLLAAGWIETRIHPDVFAAPGRLTQCYHITSEGMGALASLRWAMASGNRSE